jgi:hypothetical protein
MAGDSGTTQKMGPVGNVQSKQYAGAGKKLKMIGTRPQSAGKSIRSSGRKTMD